MWKTFAEFIPEDERGDLLEAYWRRLTSEDRELALAAAKHWAVYEGSCCTLPTRNSPVISTIPIQLGRWRNWKRLFQDAKREPDNMLLERVERIRHIPAFAVHGRYDIVCPVKSMLDLANAWPELDYTISPDSGHSSHEPGITKELVAATDRIAHAGTPVRK